MTTSVQTIIQSAFVSLTTLACLKNKNKNKAPTYSDQGCQKEKDKHFGRNQLFVCIVLAFHQ